MLSNIYKKIVTEFSKITIFFLTILIIFSLYQSKNFNLDASSDALLLEGDPDLKYLREVNQTYGSKDFLVLTYTPISNFTEKDKNWIGNLLENDGRDIYLKYKKVKDNFKYHFRNDFVNILSDFNSKRISFDDGFVCNNGQHPRLLRLLIQRRASFQSFVVLDQVLSFIKNWNKQIEEKVVWPKIAHKVSKLKPFINYNITECKLIMKEVIKNG